jgi:alpha-ribazole phosphatase
MCSTFITPEQAAAAIREQVPRAAAGGAQLTAVPLRCSRPRCLAAAWGCPHRVDARLLEIHYGAWQGRAWTAIEQEDGERFADFMQHWQHAAPPGGEGLRDLERRVASWYVELGAGDHLLVAHAGVVRALRVLIGGRRLGQRDAAGCAALGVGDSRLPVVIRHRGRCPGG